MENKIYDVSECEIVEIKKNLHSKIGIWVAEIDGTSIQTWKDYAYEIEKVMCFPTPCDKSIDAYLDWMRDLSWLNASGYALIIKNYADFMKHDIKLKKEIIEDFENIILPWWQHEVTQYSVGGISKPFDVFLTA